MRAYATQAMVAPLLETLALNVWSETTSWLREIVIVQLVLQVNTCLQRGTHLVPIIVQPVVLDTPIRPLARAVLIFKLVVYATLVMVAQTGTRYVVYVQSEITRLSLETPIV